MSERDGFTSGFLVGALVGGLVGGVIGALAASKRDSDDEQDNSLINSSLSNTKTGKSRKNQLKAEESIEVARRSLENKIAQLNTAIDDVRQQLGTVQGKEQTVDREHQREP